MTLSKRLPATLVALAGSVLLMLLGYAGLQLRFAGIELRFGEGLARLSYDLPFLIRPDVRAAEACIVYVDEASTDALSPGRDWPRSLYTRLLRRLTDDGTRAVFFDVVFSGTSTVPGEDDALAAAMKENGHVFIGAGVDFHSEEGGYAEQILPPLPLFRRAAAGWGLLAFRPVDPDYSVRLIYPGNDQRAGATWIAATKLGAPLPEATEERAVARYLNYLGPTGQIPSVSFRRAISTADEPPGYFKDKIVFIGGRPVMGSTLRLGKDEFKNPYTGWIHKSGAGVEESGHFSPGVEVHATALLNLLRGDWLQRVPKTRELAFVLLCGLLLGALSLVRPIPAVILSLLTAGGICSAAYYLMLLQHLWFSWLVPVALQIPVGLGWSLGASYFLEYRRRSMLRRAFAHYLSPQMADRIADSEFDLKPGGKVVEATIVFTDIEGFTALSESLGDPVKLSEILTTYFTRTTGHVMDEDGTIIKYIGDAVLAVWGAPIPDPRHAEKAVQAAWEMKTTANLEIHGRQLRTRIGLHTGAVLAGNLGSEQRFDYSVLGDAVNLASRLEGLNKYLGTDVLLSEATRAQIPPRFLLRHLGTFRVSGKVETVGIHELLDADSTHPPHWLALFDEGLAAFKLGDLPTATARFQQAITERGGTDGPSHFYLQQIAQAGTAALSPDWNGVVELTAK